jgi:hypothetical protein
MKPEHIATLVEVAVAVAVVAAFLIAIVVELRRTHLQLVTILGAVGETVDKTDGLEAIVNDISSDLAAGQAALADCVDRLEQRLGPVGDPQESSRPDGVGPHEHSEPAKPNVFSNY